MQQVMANIIVVGTHIEYQYSQQGMSIWQYCFISDYQFIQTTWCISSQMLGFGLGLEYTEWHCHWFKQIAVHSHTKFDKCTPNKFRYGFNHSSTTSVKLLLIGATWWLKEF